MRPAIDVRRVIDLAATGLNDCEIARRTGIPRSTVQGWRSGQRARLTESPDRDGCGMVHSFEHLPKEAYSYLRGIYLGDGCISAAARGVWRLRVSMDTAYPD